MKRPGAKSKAQTPAPKKDRKKGSKANKPGSAATSKGKIDFSSRTLQSINTIIDGSPVKLSTAKAVVRRGMGAYSSSHRPGVTRNAWGLARLKEFVKKAKGQKVKKSYTQDDDLLK
jgi:hypothetical protein